MHFVDEKTEAGVLTTPHWSLSVMLCCLPSFMKTMPWLMQVMRHRVCLKEEKEGWGGTRGAEGPGESERRDIITHELAVLWHSELSPSQSICPRFFLL